MAHLLLFEVIDCTRMHSSRMRTVRSSSHLLGGGVAARGGVCLGVYPSMHWGRHPPHPWTEWQTGVKTLPCRNYVADGKYILCCHGLPFCDSICDCTGLVSYLKTVAFILKADMSGPCMIMWHIMWSRGEWYKNSEQIFNFNLQRWVERTELTSFHLECKSF